ncbi:Thermophilic serine proteinase precursor [compost metagenome]
MKLRTTRFALAFGALASVVLAGCSMPDTGSAIRTGGQTIPMSNVYSVGGQAQLIIKRKTENAAPLKISGIKRVRLTQMPGVEVNAVTDGNVDRAIQRVEADPSVEYVEPNFRMIIPKTLDASAEASRNRAQDPNFQGSYGPKLINALEAHSRTTGEGQVIAVVDTGLDLTHPDFAGKLVPGINTAEPGKSAADDQGHGTNCAGIAGSKKNEQQGYIGVAPGAKLMPIKVLGADGSGSDASVAEGIRWAADHGATVISLSLGGPVASKTGAEAVKYALSKGAVLVAAMGNNGTGQESYPAAYPGVISVGATDINDKVTSFSQYGKWISVTAPGYSILSSFPSYRVSGLTQYEKNKAGMEKYGMKMALGYCYMTGTSQATPHVSGIAALMRASNPSLTPAQIKAKLESAAVRTAGMSGSFDTHYGYGRVDALKSL